MNPSSLCPVCGHPGEYVYTAHAAGSNDTKGYDYHRCGECALLYQNPMPNDEEISQFYPDSYAPYTEPTRMEFSRQETITLRKQLGYTHLSVPQKSKPQDFLRRPKPLNTVTPWVPNGRLLDIGCGNGEYLLRMQSIGWQCKGVEFGNQGVAVCRAQGLDIFQGGLLEASFDADTFDLVTAHHFIEHVPNPVEIITEMVRILKPGGRLLLRTPNNAALGRRWFGQYWFANGVPEHVLLFSEKSLERLAFDQGLVLEKRYRPVEFKFILKSWAMMRHREYKKHGKLVRMLAKLYIPAARLARQGDELFDIYVKP